MKTLKKVSIKVQKIIGALSRMSIYNANIIFSRMNIIFFSNAGFFGKRSSLLFWQKGNFILVGKRNTIFTEHTENIIYPCIFWVIISYLREKEMPSFMVIQERSYSSAIFLERPSFQNIWRICHISMYFFWERSSFIFRIKNKIIFSGKRIIIFPDYTRKIIFQCNFFGKIIFSDHLEKENMVFCAV